MSESGQSALKIEESRFAITSLECIHKSGVVSIGFRTMDEIREDHPIVMGVSGF